MGLAYKFYATERARHSELSGVEITDAWAARALKKLTRHFKLNRMPYGRGPVPLRFEGLNISWGGAAGIILANDRDWLIFVHEFCHVWEYRKYGKTSHHARLARLVDRTCTYVVEKKWAEEDLAVQFQEFCNQQADIEMTDLFVARAEAAA